MKRLVILSDLRGANNSNIYKKYVASLKSNYEIQFYDVRILGNIDTAKQDEQIIHSNFVNGGIEKAVCELIKIEKNPIDILGFSIGGTIAWKAAIEGLKVQNLFAVSSTRLRYETEKPNIPVHLYYGGQDRNKPNEVWFQKMSLPYKMCDCQPHNMYLKDEIIKFICFDIKKIRAANNDDK
mgnify:CR=1 FL=1